MIQQARKKKSNWPCTSFESKFINCDLLGEKKSGTNLGPNKCKLRLEAWPLPSLINWARFQFSYFLFFYLPKRLNCRNWFDRCKIKLAPTQKQTSQKKKAIVSKIEHLHMQQGGTNQKNKTSNITHVKHWCNFQGANYFS